MEKRFRAWDRYNKKMIELGTIQDIAMRHRAGYDDDFANYEILQLTGLKDKNGTEIWEGDIVDEYSNGLLVPITMGWGNDNEMYGESYGWLAGNDIISHVNHMLVVGNIYENPELLEIDPYDKYLHEN